MFSLEIHKVLTKISKEKECEHLAEWIKPCGNHLMWSATSTPSGEGEFILAKFESFLSHIVNKHADLPNGIFNKCAHRETISDRRWLEEGMHVLYIIIIKCKLVPRAIVLLEDEGRSWVGGCKCSVPVVLYCDMNNQ